MTHAQASAEIARRLGWTGIQQHSIFGHYFGKSPAGNMAKIPDYFESRDAAAELVAWFSCPPEGGETEWDEFNGFLDRLLYDLELEHGELPAVLLGGLLATPAQIAAAACAALGLELDDASAKGEGP